MYPFKRMKTKELRVKTGSKGLSGKIEVRGRALLLLAETVVKVKCERLRAAVADCSLLGKLLVK
jgi:hypothetical protein